MEYRTTLTLSFNCQRVICSDYNEQKYLRQQARVTNTPDFNVCCGSDFERMPLHFFFFPEAKGVFCSVKWRLYYVFENSELLRDISGGINGHSTNIRNSVTACLWRVIVRRVSLSEDLRRAGAPALKKLVRTRLTLFHKSSN